MHRKRCLSYQMQRYGAVESLILSRSESRILSREGMHSIHMAQKLATGLTDKIEQNDNLHQNKDARENGCDPTEYVKYIVRNKKGRKKAANV